jgi:hypothetical protein
VKLARPLPELVESYRRTDYVVARPRIRLRIGARSARLARLLERRCLHSWAFVTAWNPGSFPHPRAANRARDRELRRVLQRRGLTALRATARPRLAGWMNEAGWLVLGIARGEALALGRRFGQVAVVSGTRGRRARLVLCAARRARSEG